MSSFFPRDGYIEHESLKDFTSFQSFESEEKVSRRNRLHGFKNMVTSRARYRSPMAAKFVFAKRKFPR